MSKNENATNAYKDHTAFPSVEAYAAKNTEHAHQTALFMWAALANHGYASIRKVDGMAPMYFNVWYSQTYDERRALDEQQCDKLKLLFAVPNGGERAPAVAARMKAEGVKSGVSDLMLPCPIYSTLADNSLKLNSCGLFLEMKRPEIRDATKIVQRKGEVKTDQEEWFKQMRANGYKCAVAWTFLEALDRIWEYFNCT